MLILVFITLIVIAQVNLFFIKDYIRDNAGNFIGNTYLIKQLVFSLLAIGLYLYIKRFKQAKRILYFFNILFIINLVLLLVAFFTTYKIRATRRWIDLYLISIQPAELLKLTLPVFFVINLYTNRFIQQIGLVLIVLFSVTLVLLQPNLSNALLLFFGCLPIFIFNPFWDTSRKLYIFIFLILGFITLVRFNLKPYHYERIEGFLDMTAHEKDTAYQTLIARKLIAQIGLVKTGSRESAKNTFLLLPEKHNDFAFVSVMFNFGKLFGVFLMLIYFFLMMLMTAKIFEVDSKVVRILFISYTIELSVQVVVSLCINLTILPIAGITLPFFSYGGSSLLTFTAILALMDNKYLERTKFLYE